MDGEEEVIGHLSDDSWGAAQHIRVVNQFFEYFLIDAAVVGDEIAGEIEEDREELVPLGGVSQAVHHGLHVVHQLQPQLLLGLVVDRAEVVQEAAVGVGCDFGLFNGGWVCHMGEFLVGLVFLLEFDDVEVVLGLLQCLLYLRAWLYFP